MRNAFGFVEVLVSVVILATLGMALLKFNAFNKYTIQKNMLFLESSMLETPLLYQENLLNFTTPTKQTLLDITAFENIDDATRKFLQEQTFDIMTQEQERIYLMDDTSQARYLLSYSIQTLYKELKKEYFLLQEGD